MLTLLVTALILVGCAVLCFTGKIEVAYGETAFTVEASYYQDLTVEYAAVDHVEFREEDVPGRRQFGFDDTDVYIAWSDNLAWVHVENITYLEYEGYTLYIGKNIIDTLESPYWDVTWVDHGNGVVFSVDGVAETPDALIEYAKQIIDLNR